MSCALVTFQKNPGVRYRYNVSTAFRVSKGIRKTRLRAGRRYPLTDLQSTSSSMRHASSHLHILSSTLDASFPNQVNHAKFILRFSAQSMRPPSTPCRPPHPSDRVHGACISSFQYMICLFASIIIQEDKRQAPHVRRKLPLV